MVRGRTREVCQRELDRICGLPGIEPAMKPTDAMPPGWVARAVLRQTASEPEPGQQ